MTAIGQLYQFGTDNFWKSPGRISIASNIIGGYEPLTGLTGFDGSYTVGGPISTGSMTVVTHSGSLLLSTNGASYDSMDYACYVGGANNLTGSTWSRCRFRGDNTTMTGNYALFYSGGQGVTGLVFNDCTFQPDFPNLWIDGIIGHDYTASRCKVLNTVDGFGIYNNFLTGAYASNVTIRGCFVDLLSYFTPDPNHSDNQTHNDCVQVQAGTNIVIYGNGFHGNIAPGIGQYSSAGRTQSTTFFIINRIAGTSLDVNLDTNWLYGGGYTYNASGTLTGPVGSVTNNIFGHDGQFAATADMQIGITNGVTFTAFSGNVRAASAGGGAATVHDHI